MMTSSTLNDLYIVLPKTSIQDVTELGCLQIKPLINLCWYGDKFIHTLLEERGGKEAMICFKGSFSTITIALIVLNTLLKHIMLISPHLTRERYTASKCDCYTYWCVGCRTVMYVRKIAKRTLNHSTNQPTNQPGCQELGNTNHCRHL